MSCSANKMNESIQAYMGACQATACLLQSKVDETLEMLKQEQVIALNQRLQVESFVSGIKDCELSAEFDPDDELNDGLLYIEKLLREIYEFYQLGLDDARVDTALKGINEQHIITEYEHTMSAISEHYAANEKLRLLIVEIDADLAPVSELFDNADDLIAKLNS